MTARDWDAGTYDRVSGPQVEWAERVLDRLPLRGDETVLDAGCGSGRVTRLLLDRLPEGRVVAVDASRSMVEHAREVLDVRATVLQGTWPSWSSRSRSTRSSRTPCSTGCRTTRGCSSACSPRCAPAAG